MFVLCFSDVTLFLEYVFVVVIMFLNLYEFQFVAWNKLNNVFFFGYLSQL